MAHVREFAVHDHWRANDFCSESCPDALMAEADAQDRGCFSKATNHVARNARLLRSTWPGGNNNLLRSKGLDPVQTDFVVAKNSNVSAQLAEIMVKVVS